MRGLLGLALALMLGMAAPVAEGSPRELGAVTWERDFARAERRAESTGRPLFALFQEVPGCQTCVSFGEQVLSHPLLVEAIESEFVPVAVYNNAGGADREILARFGEPSYNNPVVRLLDPTGNDLLPRKDGVWFPRAIGARMLAALEAHGRPLPAYLREAVEELSVSRRARATFGMHCFWSGEACLGEIDGILESRAGWLDGSEVVEVSFDPDAIDYAELLRKARAKSCTERVFTHTDEQQRAAQSLFGKAAKRVREYARDAGSGDQKRALRGTPYEKLGLTPRQAVRVNAAVAAQRSPSQWLSPRQRDRVGRSAR